MIRFCSGDLLKSPEHYIAQGVAEGNQEGLGTGLALKISKQWPEVQAAFKKYSRSGRSKGGSIWVCPQNVAGRASSTSRRTGSLSRDAALPSQSAARPREVGRTRARLHRRASEGWRGTGQVVMGRRCATAVRRNVRGEQLRVRGLRRLSSRARRVALSEHRARWFGTALSAFVRHSKRVSTAAFARVMAELACVDASQGSDLRAG